MLLKCFFNLDMFSFLQVRVTVFPAKPVALYTGVPWWIIAVAIFAGVLMLALLVFLLWKCGFFQRSRYDDSVPRYHAVRIRKEEREIKDGKCKDLETKQWFTKWNENESYSQGKVVSLLKVQIERNAFVNGKTHGVRPVNTMDIFTVCLQILLLTLRLLFAQLKLLCQSLLALFNFHSFYPLQI